MSLRALLSHVRIKIPGIPGSMVSGRDVNPGPKIPSRSRRDETGPTSRFFGEKAHYDAEKQIMPSFITLVVTLLVAASLDEKRAEAEAKLTSIQ